MIGFLCNHEYFMLENIILRKNVYYSPDATDTKTGPV